MVSVPHGEEDECAELAGDPVIEEAEPLVDVVQHPGVRVDVERLHHVVESCHALKSEGPKGESLTKWLTFLFYLQVR